MHLLIDSVSGRHTETVFRGGLRRDLGLAGLVVLAFFVVGGAWAYFTQISGAVVSNGVVSVEADLQRVQYLDGGVVSKILVHNGDEVKAGQLLAQMDAAGVQGQFDIAQSRVIEAFLLQSRLQAQLDGTPSFEVPPELSNVLGTVNIDAAYKSQLNLLTNWQQGQTSRRQLLLSQLDQTNSNIEGLSSSAEAIGAESALLDDQLAGLQTLLKDNLIEKSRVMDTQRAVVNLRGELASTTAQISAARSSSSQVNLQLIQLDETARSENLQALQDVRAQLGELIKLYVAEKNALARTEIRAPRDGVVHESNINTPGQVLSSGADIMMIVPKDDRLIIEGQIRTVDVDQVHVGQRASVKLAAYDARLLPELLAKVVFVSADAVSSQNGQLTYYTSRLELLPGELDKLKDIELIPGMPVQVFIKKQDRSVLTFLMDPLLERLEFAFRE